MLGLAPKLVAASIPTKKGMGKSNYQYHSNQICAASVNSPYRYTKYHRKTNMTKRWYEGITEKWINFIDNTSDHRNYFLNNSFLHIISIVAPVVHLPYPYKSTYVATGHLSLTSTNILL